MLFYTFSAWLLITIIQQRCIITPLKSQGFLPFYEGIIGRDSELKKSVAHRVEPGFQKTVATKFLSHKDEGSEFFQQGLNHYNRDQRVTHSFLIPS